MKTTLEISEKYSKRHRDILESVRKVISKVKDYERCCEVSEYKNSKGRIYPMYILKGDLLELVETRCKHGVRTSKITEKEYIYHLKKIFPRFKEQVKIGEHIVDLYDEENCIIVEIDENYHNIASVKNRDKKREEKIKEILSKKLMEEDGVYSDWRKYKNCIEIIRIKEGELGEGIREMILKLDGRNLKRMYEYID
ncbi:Rha family transcriptional regulator [Cetobacterium sp.]|uniref:Rha family transcriptional regulator n=1 Tax=Cetobacterium sp. TaxID=2071632 RepID=UPI003F366242